MLTPAHEELHAGHVPKSPPSHVITLHKRRQPLSSSHSQLCAHESTDEQSDWMRCTTSVQLALRQSIHAASFDGGFLQTTSSLPEQPIFWLDKHKLIVANTTKAFIAAESIVPSIHGIPPRTASVLTVPTRRVCRVDVLRASDRAQGAEHGGENQATVLRLPTPPHEGLNTTRPACSPRARIRAHTARGAWGGTKDAGRGGAR
jgi:hypothetical protein